MPTADHQNIDERLEAFLRSVEDLAELVEPGDQWPVVVLVERAGQPPIPLQFHLPEPGDETADLAAVIAELAAEQEAEAVLLLVPAYVEGYGEVLVASAHFPNELRVRISCLSTREEAPPIVGQWLSPRELPLGPWFVDAFRLTLSL